MSQNTSRIMSPQELESAIRQVGAERYHDKHPFHRLLHGGKLNKGRCRPGRSTATATRPACRARTLP
jgi:hypothetical protein